MWDNVCGLRVGERVERYSRFIIEKGFGIGKLSILFENPSIHLGYNIYCM